MRVPISLATLPRKGHQAGVEGDRQQHVTKHHARQRHNRLELVDVPRKRNKIRLGHNHQPGHRHDGEGYAKPELLQHLRDLDEEVRKLEFLRGRAPCHVDLEHVGQDRLRHVNGDAAEEDEEHEEPLEIFDECRHEGALAGAVAEGGESNIAEAVEDDDERDPDVPAVDIVFVDVYNSR